MAALSPEKQAEAQADFVKSAVRSVRYGPLSLSEFTQWRVCPHAAVLPGGSPSSFLPGSHSLSRPGRLWPQEDMGSRAGQGRWPWGLERPFSSSDWLSGRGWRPQDCAQLPNGLLPSRCR